jgi:hypothetical protein
MMSFEPSILHSAVSIYQQGLEGHLEAHPQIPQIINIAALQEAWIC